MSAAERFLFTSESVTEGHPDKIADQVSDAILDACLEQDPYSRVACETLTATGLVVIAGEITTRAYVDFQALVRGVVSAIGYDNAVYGFDSNTCAVISTINKQSGDIAMGVDTGGAGDQGMMFGYATERDARADARPHLARPQAHPPAHRGPQAGKLDYLRPDGKTQVTVEYDESQAGPHRRRRHLHAARRDRHQRRAPRGHPEARHPGGAPRRSCSTRTPSSTSTRPAASSSADPGRHRPHRPQDHRRQLRRHGPSRRRRLQRQGPDKGRPLRRYCARYIAKNIVAAGLAERCEVQLAYAIGVAEPVSVRVDTFGTGTIAEPELVAPRPRTSR